MDLNLSKEEQEALESFYVYCQPLELYNILDSRQQAKVTATVTGSCPLAPYPWQSLSSAVLRQQYVQPLFLRRNLFYSASHHFARKKPQAVGARYALAKHWSCSLQLCSNLHEVVRNTPILHAAQRHSPWRSDSLRDQTRRLQRPSTPRDTGPLSLLSAVSRHHRYRLRTELPLLPGQYCLTGSIPRFGKMTCRTCAAGLHPPPCNHAPCLRE